MAEHTQKTSRVPSGAVPGVQRGCGYRVQGGAYLETSRSPSGQPLEYFLADPPIPYDPDHKRGMEIVERKSEAGSTFHVVDWIGQEHYPCAADFLEEVRSYGLSRRAPKNLDFSKLTEESRILCVHAEAYLENASGFTAAARFLDNHYEVDFRSKCRHFLCGRGQRERTFHLRDPGQPCTRHLWAFAAATTEMPHAQKDPGVKGKIVEPQPIRQHASVTYEVFPPGAHVAHSEDLPAPQWKPGIIASFPVSRIAVIENENGSGHEATRAAISAQTDLGVATERA